MKSSTSSATPVVTSAVWPVIFKVAAVLLVMVEVAGFIYGFFYSMLAHDTVQALLSQAQIDNILLLENQLLGMTLAPMVYAVLAAISPLIGWWIYSRVETPSQYAVGWGGAGLFAFVYVVIGLLNQGSMARMGLNISLLATFVGLALIIVYVVFFMGIGYNIAKLFKLKL